MRPILVALLLVLPALAQDEAKIQDLIQKLDSDSIDERENAQHDLAKIGPPAIPYLKKTIDGAKDRADLRVRCEEALKAIELSEKVKGVYRDPKRITLDVADVPLKEALAKITEQTGVKFDAGSVDGDQRITLKVADASLYETLDRICADREEVSFEYRDEGTVKLLKEKHRATPAAYFGPFRFRLIELTVLRKTNFKEKLATVTIGIEPEHEKYLKPSRHVRLEVTKIVDDKGKELEMIPVEEDPFAAAMGANPGGRMFIRRALGALGKNVDEPEHLFKAKNLSPDAKSLATIQGTAIYSFPLESRDIAFTNGVQRGESKVSGDWTFKIDRINMRRGTLDISFTRAKGKGAGDINEEISTRLDSDSLVAVDEDGKEYKADSFGLPTSNTSVVMMNGGMEDIQRTITYQAVISNAKNKSLKELRFKFIDRMFDKSVPFVIKGVELP